MPMGVLRDEDRCWRRWRKVCSAVRAENGSDWSPTLRPADSMALDLMCRALEIVPEAECRNADEVVDHDIATTSVSGCSLKCGAHSCLDRVLTSTNSRATFHFFFRPYTKLQLEYEPCVPFKQGHSLEGQVSQQAANHCRPPIL